MIKLTGEDHLNGGLSEKNGDLEGGGIFLDRMRGIFNAGNAEVEVEGFSEAFTDESVPVERGMAPLGGLRMEVKGDKGRPGLPFNESDEGVDWNGKQGQVRGPLFPGIGRKGMIGKWVLLDAHLLTVKD